MRALTVRPGVPGSAALEQRRAFDQVGHDRVRVRTVAIGVCGTDAEILAGRYGQAPEGCERLVLGHESVGQVAIAPAGGDLEEGDWVVGIVRHPDPVPCENCAIGEWDMCRNGRYTEHGIKGRDGFCAEYYEIDRDHVVRIDPALGPLGVLLEPTSVVAKAWEHIEHIGNRARWSPKRVLITGAGPVGLLAAMLGHQRGLDVHLFDQVAGGPKTELARSLGAHYHHGNLDALLQEITPDVVVECTGAAPVVLSVMGSNARGGIVCLVGVSSHGAKMPVDLGALNRSLVLENDVVFGSVNANRRHYEQAAHALARADHAWLTALITRQLPLERWQAALQRQEGDVKVVIRLA